MNKSLEEIILDLVQLFKPYLKGLNSVLDIGTGTSIPIHVFAKVFPAISYSTVDVIDMRKRKELPFLLCDGKNLPFNNLEFDVSLLNETLHHCEDAESVLNEARRVAKSVYVIEHFPNPDSDINQLTQDELDALSNFDMTCNIYNPFTEPSLYDLFEKTGLSVSERVEIPYYGEREIKKYFFKLGKQIS